MPFVSMPANRPKVAADEVVGRDDVLAAVAGFLDGPPGGALVLQGSAGIGKTTVWLAARELARRRGYEVLSARPTGAEVSLSLAGFGDLLRDVPRGAVERLPAPQSRAVAVALAEEDAGEERIDGRVLGVALLNLLRLRAEESPVLLAIDDLQWLDEPSLAVVVFALRRIAGTDVRLLAARRAEPGTPLPPDLEQSLDEGSLERVDLGPLSEGAVRRLLRQRLGMGISRSQLHGVYAATGGNPFFVLELARAGLQTDDDGLIRLPGSLQTLVRQRLQSLPAATRDALVFVAALSEPRRGVLERVHTLEPLEPAIAAGILELESETLRFDHPLFAAAAWRTASAERRRAVHLALAEAVEDPEQRARHLALGTAAADAGVAAIVEAAAALARARGAPAAAAELLDRACELTPDEEADAWAGRASAAAAAHAAAGNWERLTALVEEAQGRLPAGPDRAAIVVVAAEMRPGLSTHFRQAVEEAGETAVGVRARIGLAEQAASAGGWQEAVDAAGAAVALAKRLGRRDLLGAALTSLAGSRLLGSDPAGFASLEEALEIERELGGLPTSTYGSAETWRMYTLLWSDDFHRARPLLDRKMRSAREQGDEVSYFQLLWLLGSVELAQGQPARARALWREGLEPVERLGYEYARSTFLTLLADIEAHEGNLGQARALTVEALPLLEATGDVILAAAVHVSMLLVELCEGRPEAALAHADAVSAIVPGARESWWSRHQGNEIEALVLAGEHDRAVARIESLRAAGAELELPRFLAWADRGEGLLLAAQEDLGGACAALESALAHHARTPIPLERARTLLIQGNVLRRSRQRRAARAALEEALAEFERIGAGHFARRAAAELKHVAGRVPSREGQLTETEDRAARLVASGLSNSEVAARLFVTVSTVEATLSRVYAKLGIRSRLQLARALGDPVRDPAGPVA